MLTYVPGFSPTSPFSTRRAGDAVLRTPCRVQSEAGPFYWTLVQKTSEEEKERQVARFRHQASNEQHSSVILSVCQGVPM